MQTVYGARRTVKRAEDYTEVFGDPRGIRYIQRQGDKDRFFDATGQEVNEAGKPVYADKPETKQKPSVPVPPEPESRPEPVQTKSPQTVSSRNTQENMCPKCGYKARSQLDLKIHSRTCK